MCAVCRGGVQRDPVDGLGGCLEADWLAGRQSNPTKSSGEVLGMVGLFEMEFPGKGNDR